MNDSLVMFGYNIQKRLGESLKAEVFKVIDKNEPGRPLILKRIKQDIKSPAEIYDRLKQQIAHCQKPYISGLKIPSLHRDGEGNIFIIREYFDGIPLSEWQKSQKKISLNDFFKIACRLAEIISDIHRAGCIHGGIKPNNILITPDTLDVSIVDIIRLIDIKETSHFICHEDFRLNTLPYISPEQTGRIRQPVDNTTDFYSLGIISYELLGEAPPFSSAEPLEIIHSHLAENPPSLSQIKPDVPEMLSIIAAKLMRKEPENRYSTGDGLLHDLKRCENEFLKTGKIDLFSPGEKDYAGRISIPSIMVGRDREKELLLDEYAISASGEFRCAFISGLPGIGKTRLVQELQLPIVSSRGYFTSGKFDQYQKNVPYSALIQAFRNLIRIFLSEDASRIRYWEDTIKNALGSNARLITDIIPELELLIGPQNEAPELPPIEAKNRFNSTVGKFISCLAGPDHPITLHVDDLQWTDTASLDIIENIYKNTEDHPYFFLICAHRHNEVDESHPLSHLLKNIRQYDRPILELRVRELEPRHTEEIVSYILNTSGERAGEIAGFIGKTSQGNPLYINESLSWLHDSNFIYPGNDGIWQWDIKRLSHTGIPDSIVTIFTDRIKKMPDDTRRFLQRASCLGAVFNAEDLALTSYSNMSSIYNNLAPAFDHRILVQEGGIIYFFHDRVHEAVYNMLDDEERRAIHAELGEILLSAIPDNLPIESFESLYNITNHLNKGRFYKDKKRLYRDARLNYHAGNKAVSSLALELACHFYQTAHDLLPENCWHEEYELTYLIKKNLAINLGTQGRQAEAEKYFLEIIDHIKLKSEKAEIYMEVAVIYGSRGYHREGIDHCNRALALYGRQMSDDNDVIEEQLHCLYSLLKDSPPQAFDNTSGEEELNILLRCYNILIPFYYLQGLPWQTFYISLLSYQLAGNIQSESVDKLMSFPLSLCAGFFRLNGDHEQAEIIEERALNLCLQRPNTFGSGKGLASLSWINLPWTKSIEEIQYFAKKGMESCANYGDVFYSSGSNTVFLWAACLEGKNFQSIYEGIQSCRSYSEEHNVNNFTEMMIGLEHAFAAPITETINQIDIQDHLNIWDEMEDASLFGNYFTFKAWMHYLNDEQRECMTALSQGEPYLEGLVSAIPKKLWHVAFVLNRIRLYGLSTLEKEKSAMEIEINEKKEILRTWDRLGVILRPYIALITAEEAVFGGDFSVIRKLYLDAIDIAQEYGYTLLEGHVNECLGKFLYEYKNDMAGWHINEAANLYNKCLAEAKLRLIQKRYPEYFQNKHSEKIEETSTASAIDTTYLIKAYTAISQELDFNRLIETITKIIMERVGAESGYILTVSDEDIFIRSEGTKGNTLNVVTKKEPLSEAKGLARVIVRYVRRTKDTVILGNAIVEGPFVSDVEVQKLRLRSVLCQPIMKQQKLVGVIYLHNNMIRSVFTEEQVDFIRLLSAQAAISMENAMLVDNMKQAESKLRRSEERFRSLVETTSDWIWEIDLNLSYIYVSPKVKQILGYEPGNIVGKTPFDLMPSNESKRIRPIFQDILSFRSSFNSLENINIHKNGKIVFLESSGVPILDEHDNLIGYRGIDRDITERKIAEMTLMESERKYRALIESTDTGYVIIDMDGKIFEANDEYVRLSGHKTLDKIIGRPVFDWVAEYDRKRNVEEIKKCIETGNARNLRIDYTLTNGDIIPVEINAVVVETGGRRVILAMVRDITERAQYEDKIRASLKEKEALLRELHHRVKNNMQLITSMISLQCDQVKDKQYSDMFKESQKRIRSIALIHEKLYQSKNFSEININEYVRALVDNLIHSYKSDPDKIIFKTEIEDIPLELDTAIPCGLIINELVSNSLKYAFPKERKGEIRIILCSINKDELELTVRDNGIGIPEEIDFENSESLGLELVHILAEHQLGGKIELNRKEGVEVRVRFKKQPYIKRV